MIHRRKHGALISLIKAESLSGVLSVVPVDRLTRDTEGSRNKNPPWQPPISTKTTYIKMIIQKTSLSCPSDHPVKSNQIVWVMAPKAGRV